METMETTKLRDRLVRALQANLLIARIKRGETVPG